MHKWKVWAVVGWGRRRKLETHCCSVLGTSLEIEKDRQQGEKVAQLCQQLLASADQSIQNNQMGVRAKGWASGSILEDICHSRLEMDNWARLKH